MHVKENVSFRFWQLAALWGTLSDPYPRLGCLVSFLLGESLSLSVFSRSVVLYGFSTRDERFQFLTLRDTEIEQ